LNGDFLDTITATSEFGAAIVYPQNVYEISK